MIYQFNFSRSSLVNAVISPDIFPSFSQIVQTIPQKMLFLTFSVTLIVAEGPSIFLL